MPETLPSGWRRDLEPEFKEEYFRKLIRDLHGEKFFPRPEQILRCLTFFECEDAKVVILGQDPYHGPGQAEGLSFSIPAGVARPPSLVNIMKEIADSTGKASRCKGGSLVRWAEQGVLLLNTVLTVKEKLPRSHSNMKWHLLTDRIIELVSEKGESVVFMLWGRDAQEKERLIDRSRHLVLKSPHPSPLSARKGFFGNNHFKIANEYLASKGKGEIEW